MDPFEELERMALNAGRNEEPSEQRISDWQRIFGYSKFKARARIMEHHADVTRLKVSDEHWRLLPGTEKQHFGFDQDAYEHHLQLAKANSSMHTPITSDTEPGVDLNKTYVCKFGDLGEPFYDAGEVRIVASLPETPKVFSGWGDTGSARFCLVNSRTKQRIEAWLQAHGHELMLFAPYSTISVGPATKNLCKDSAYPTLGLETTLPQHRPQAANVRHEPEQNVYPVWYFFYGTLAEPEKLSQLTGLPVEKIPALEKAQISGGVIKSWGGRCSALVDGPAAAVVDGWAFQVVSKRQEEALLKYETSAYEVVRCNIVMHGGYTQKKGCTFRFVDASILV